MFENDISNDQMITPTKNNSELTENADHSCCHKRKQRSDEDKKALINRLSRMEGQIRGIKSMVEKDAYCPDILVQAAAVTSAMNAFNRVLLTEHIKTCVVDDVRKGNDSTIDELTALIQRLMK